MRNIKLASDGAGGGSDGSANNDSKKTYTAEEVAALTADRDAARAERDRAKEAKRIADEALAEKERVEREAKAALEGNIEDLRKSHSEKVTTLEAEKKAALDKLEKAILRSDVLSVLAEVSIDPEVAFLLLKDDFEVKTDDNGVSKARPKSESSSVKDYILKKLEAKPHLLKNPRANGADTKKTSENGKSEMTKEKLLAMTSEQRQYHFAKHPEDRKLVS